MEMYKWDPWWENDWPVSVGLHRHSTSDGGLYHGL
jgi:hypothetical protein